MAPNRGDLADQRFFNFRKYWLSRVNLDLITNFTSRTLKQRLTWVGTTNDLFLTKAKITCITFKWILDRDSIDMCLVVEAIMSHCAGLVLSRAKADLT